MDEERKRAVDTLAHVLHTLEVLDTELSDLARANSKAEELRDRVLASMARLDALREDIGDGVL